MSCIGTSGGPPGGKGRAAGGTRTSKSVRKSAAPVAERDLWSAMRCRQRVHAEEDSEFAVCPGAAHTRGSCASADLEASLAAEPPTKWAAVWSKNEGGIPPGPSPRMPSQWALVAIC